MVKSPGFLRLIRTAIGRPDAKVLSSTKHNGLLASRYRRFCAHVGDLLRDENAKCLGAPFLSVQHDAWTSVTKGGVIGASAVFIDHRWRFRYLALLAGAKNDGHQARQVAKLITDRCTELFGVSVPARAQYIVSDTTASARKVSETFGGSVQTDCAMHRLNLCIAYGIGLKENTKTTMTTNQNTGQREKIARIVTQDGALPEGGAVIKKMRVLNNFFSTS